MSSLVKLLFLHEVSGTVPKSVKLSDCSLEFDGQKRTRGLITGVYGTSSKQIALEGLARWNSRNAMSAEDQAAGAVPSKLVMVDAEYKVTDLEVIRQRVSSETLAQSGWLNMERLVPDLRETIKGMWLDWLSKEEGPTAAKRVRDESLLKLVQTYPQFVPNLFGKGLNGVVHPVKPRFAPDVTLWGATVRMEPKYFASAASRWAQIQVKIA